jgi:hypothetical protein
VTHDDYDDNINITGAVKGETYHEKRKSHLNFSSLILFCYNDLLTLLSSTKLLNNARREIPSSCKISTNLLTRN